MRTIYDVTVWDGHIKVGNFESFVLKGIRESVLKLLHLQGYDISTIRYKKPYVRNTSVTLEVCLLDGYEDEKQRRVCVDVKRIDRDALIYDLHNEFIMEDV